MLTNIHRKHIFGNLEGLAYETTVSKVVSFVEKYLIVFSNEFAGSLIVNEKGLTQMLCILLNKNARDGGYPFHFEKEFMEEVERGDSPQVDIGVVYYETETESIDTQYYSSRGAFFAMEAKRLDKISTTREKEYLIGRQEKDSYIHCGGVERFKNEIHGKGLRYACVIGYVQKYDFDYWHHSINSWIDSLIEGKILSSVKWSEKDKLVQEYKLSHTAKFKSENSRTSGSILLFHLWVNLINTPTNI